MEKTKVEARRYFAGANTKYGFYNLFGEINRADRPGFLFILKGGPGTGKSTLMKKIGKAFEKRTRVEYFYCSSDYESLDGVRIPDVNVAVVDGTAPHVTETVIPGAREKIIDLGAFIDDSIKQNEKEIAGLLKRKKLFFEQVYLYIKNASNLYECNNLIFSSLYKDASAEAAKQARKIFKELVPCETNKNKKDSGKSNKCSLDKNGAAKTSLIRKLFLSAVAGEGFVDFTPHNNYAKVYELEYDTYLSGLILKDLTDIAKKRGNDATCFCDVLAPEVSNGVFIPQSDVLIKRNTENEIKIKDKALAETISYNNRAINAAASAASLALNKAKQTHKQIEEFYFPAMDFAAVDKLTQMLIDDIEERFYSY